MKRAIAIGMVISATLCACQSQDEQRTAAQSQSRPRPVAQRVTRGKDARLESKLESKPPAPPTKIGVVECDEYLEKYSACLRHEALARSRPRMERALSETREAWRQTATTAEGREGLAQACKIAGEAAAKSVRVFGCRW